MSKHEYRVDGYEDSDTKDQIKAIQRIFRNVFSTPEGKVALNVLLSDLRYYRPAENEADYALCEYAKKFLRVRLGLEDTVALTESVLATISKEHK